MKRNAKLPTFAKGQGKEYTYTATRLLLLVSRLYPLASVSAVLASIHPALNVYSLFIAHSHFRPLTALYDRPRNRNRPCGGFILGHHITYCIHTMHLWSMLAVRRCTASFSVVIFIFLSQVRSKWIKTSRL